MHHIYRKFNYSRNRVINWVVNMKMSKDIFNIFLSIFIPLVLVACSHTPKQSVSHSNPKHVETQTTESRHLTLGQQIADLARLQVGAPYRYGGASPKGFDCSGLVYYTHGKFGISTPRTSYAQFNHARPIKLNQLESGDLVFFKIDKKSISHVGIYVGKGQFVHAPKSGKEVSKNHLNDDFWKSRIVSAGRLY